MNDKTVYEFTVNGTPIKTPHEKLTAGDIIQPRHQAGCQRRLGKAGRLRTPVAGSSRPGVQVRRHRRPSGI